MSALGIITVANAAFVFALTFAAAQSRVHVVEGVDAARLANALAKEPDLVVGTASSADVIVSLAPAGSAVMLVVREKNGSTALERRIDLDRGLDPAMRMAVLLVRGALEPAEVAEEVALPAWQADLVQPSLLAAAPMIGVERARLVESSRAPLGWRFEVAPAIACGDALHIDPAFALSFRARSDRFAVGISGVLGAGVGVQNENAVLGGHIADSMVLVDASWSFSSLGGVAFSAFASAGVDVLRFEAGALIYEGSATQDTRVFPVPVLLAGAEARYPLTRSIALEVRGGARILPYQIQRSVPALFPADVPVSPLKSDLLGLFLSAGISLQIL